MGGGIPRTGSTTAVIFLDAEYSKIAVVASKTNDSDLGPAVSRSAHSPVMRDDEPHSENMETNGDTKSHFSQE